MSIQQWDIKLWIITILLGIAISLGTYNLKTMAMEIEGVKERAAILVTRQAVDDERFEDVRRSLSRLEISVEKLTNLFEKYNARK